jgi:hypothetical protein
MTLEKIDQWAMTAQRRKARTRNLMQLSKQSLELVTVFIETSEETIQLFFSFTRQPENLKIENRMFCTKSNDII